MKTAKAIMEREPLSGRILTVRVPKALLALIDAQAKRQKETRSILVRSALERFLTLSSTR